MKQIEIGVIPEDWEVGDLKSITNLFKSGYGITSKDISENDGDYPVYGGNGLRGYSKTFTHYDDLLLIGRQGALCGNLNYVRGKVFVSEHAIAVKANTLNNTKYFYYAFERLNLNSLSESSAQPGLSVEKLLKLQIPLPPLAEQEAIASALSDADAWIESLEQLIAKKRLIKQGAMQSLLTPKEDWESKTLLEIADKKRDLFNDGDWIESEHIIEEGIRLVQTGNIGIGRFLNKGNRKYISEKSFNELKCKELREGDLLICRLAEPAGRACIFPKTEDFKSVTSVDVTIFRPDAQKYNREFLMYIFCTNNWFTDIIEKVGGTTHKRISRGNLGNITIKIPPLSEQERIATILSDMDAELEALETQLGKARQIKQGMMQELLTGKTRLIDN